MPREPEWLSSSEWELEGATSRFTLDPAIAVGIPEREWDLDPGARTEDRANSLLSERFGEWVHEEQEELGRGHAELGSTGRGAAGTAAVLTFIAHHAAEGVIATAAGMAFKKFAQRAWAAFRGRDEPVYVSRGGAVYLAVAEVAERFDEPGPVELEAAEEPSAIAGGSVSELSYVGVEPWIVLLRNRDRLRRYLVVVSAGGEILGAMETPMGEWENVFLPPDAGA